MEKTLLVIVQEHKSKHWAIEDVTLEMQELTKTSGGDVVCVVEAKLDEVRAATMIGKGKVEEIADLISLNKIDVVIFSCELKGNQQRNLEEAFHGVKTIDRTQLILDIFARHASTNEGRMQVELAQLQYLLPRLVGKGIALSRLGGGIGTLGPGETKLEVDRRRISDRISHLKDELKKVVSSRAIKRRQRQKQSIPCVSLVGYTNAGKSTLLNALTHAGTRTKDGLFTTLDSLSRQMILPNHQKIIVSDTVGFIHDLPHGLIESFKATLEEVHQSDLLLHVVDVSHQRFDQLYESVNSVLKELDSLDKPTLVVLNKIDQLADDSDLKTIERRFKYAVSVSAKQEINLEKLQDLIIDLLKDRFITLDIVIPLDRMDLVNVAHNKGEVHNIEYLQTGVKLSVSLPLVDSGPFMGL